MKKSALKKLIKEVIKEVHQQRMGGSETLDDYNIYIPDGEIPGFTQGPTEMEITANIGYDYDPGEEARGMSGPPENSSPGYGSQVDVFQGEATEVTLYPEGKPKITIDYHNQMSPEQQKVVALYVAAYIESKEGQEAISQQVESGIESQASDDFEEPYDEPHYDWEDR
jgi:hypothetical protein